MTDAAQVRQRLAAVPEPGQAPVQPEERVLDHILGALLVAEQQRRHPDESNRVRTEQTGDQVGRLASGIGCGIVGW